MVTPGMGNGICQNGQQGQKYSAGRVSEVESKEMHVNYMPQGGDKGYHTQKMGAQAYRPQRSDVVFNC